MKLLSFRKDGVAGFGVLSEVDGAVVALRERTGLADMTELLEAGIHTARRFAGQAGDFPLEATVIGLPVPNPQHMFGIGLNTYSHLAEAGKPRSDAPEHPMVFVRFPSSVTADGQALQKPSDVTTFDYEGEIALIIGRSGRNIPVESALNHVAAVSCFNDGSVREYQRHTSQVIPGKNFDASGAFGPYLVTVDEVGDLNGLSLSTRINGEVKQKLTTDDLIFGFDELISYLSHAVTLQPGDVIATGSPAGVAVFSPPYLADGDEVSVTIPGVGTLTNTVADVAPTPRKARS